MCAALPWRTLYVFILQGLGRYNYRLAALRTVRSLTTARVGDATEAERSLMGLEGTAPGKVPGTLLGTSKKEGETCVRSDVRSDIRSDVGSDV